MFYWNVKILKISNISNTNDIVRWLKTFVQKIVRSIKNVLFSNFVQKFVGLAKNNDRYFQ